MSTVVTFGVLGAWPGTPTVARREATFRTTYTDSMRLLREELARIDVDEARILVDVDASAIRTDGSMRADTRPRTPGIVLEFTKPARAGQPPREIRMPHDAYWHWQHNIRAAALTLEALRAVARYGGASQDEQYRGYARLGSGEGGVNTAALTLSPERAARVLVEAHPKHLGHPTASAELFVRTLLDRTATEVAIAFARESRAAAHPDSGNTLGTFPAVDEAYRVLLRYHGRGA